MMNNTTRTVTALGLTALAAVGLATGGAIAASAAPVGTTSSATELAGDDLADALTYMREEERLARDLYAAIADYYDGARPFSKITGSEDSHFDAVGVLLDRYGIDDPSDGLAAGTYAFDDLQALYDDLLADAQTSIAAAYDAGITVEETDIEDLGAVIAEGLPDDVEVVFTNLLNGSENHLAAFTAASDGTSAALGGSTGSGGGNGSGNGSGAMQGNANGARAAVATRADGDCILAG